MGNQYNCFDALFSSKQKFGGVVRTNFMITIKWVSGDEWEVIEGPVFAER